jgi:DNA-binding HxlR family transcriptional regulator
MAQKVIKGKWKLLIFWHIQQGTKRFNELDRLLPCNQATLSRQLKELEQDQVVHREVYTVIPPKVEYSLTPLGEKFCDVINSMGSWGLAYFQANGMFTDAS